jgi:hypothetical protein
MRQNPEDAARRVGLPPLDLAVVRRRGLLRARVEICAALRRKTGAAAIGATLAAALRLGEDAAAELALIPDTAELRRHDEALLAGADALADGASAQIGRLVDEYKNGRALDLFTASPTELLACCVARVGAG